MLKIRPSKERGQINQGWLESAHTFSFSDYYDARYMRFRSLRVINEDRIQPGQGFGQHPHEDMEILTYVITGSLKHSDSMGNGSMIQPGDVQIMSAGTGILHSEANDSKTESLHLLQIWMLPNQRSLRPRYEQKYFSASSKRNQLKLIGSKTGREESVTIHQEIDLYSSLLEPNYALSHTLEPNRGAWLQLIQGELIVNGATLKTGDGLSIEGESQLSIEGKTQSEFLLFDIL